MKPSVDPLLALLLGGTRAAVLSVLLSDSAHAVHVRELARITGTSAGSLHRELRLLAQVGLLRREQIGRQVFYSAQTTHPRYPALAALVGGLAAVPSGKRGTGRRRGRDDAAPRFSAERLATVCRRHHVRRLAMFGSAARNQLKKRSDVDLIVEFEEGRAPSFWDTPGIEDELSTVFGGRPVDLLPPEVLANPFRRDAILPDLTVLYEAKQEAANDPPRGHD